MKINLHTNKKWTSTELLLLYIYETLYSYRITDVQPRYIFAIIDSLMSIERVNCYKLIKSCRLGYRSRFRYFSSRLIHVSVYTNLCVGYKQNKEKLNRKNGNLWQHSPILKSTNRQNTLWSKHNEKHKIWNRHWQ